MLRSSRRDCGACDTGRLEREDRLPQLRPLAGSTLDRRSSSHFLWCGRRGAVDAWRLGAVSIWWVVVGRRGRSWRYGQALTEAAGPDGRPADLHDLRRGRARRDASADAADVRGEGPRPAGAHARAARGSTPRPTSSGCASSSGSRTSSDSTSPASSSSCGWRTSCGGHRRRSSASSGSSAPRWKASTGTTAATSSSTARNGFPSAR